MTKKYDAFLGQESVEKYDDGMCERTRGGKVRMRWAERLRC